MPRLVAEDVSKTFGVNGTTLAAVRGATLRLEAGDFVAITGHSGSGKTTLLSMLGGLSRPSSGTVRFDGADLYGLDADALSEYRCEHVGFVFQFASLLPALTAFKTNLQSLESTFRRTMLMLGMWPDPEERARLIERVKAAHFVHDVVFVDRQESITRLIDERKVLAGVHEPNEGAIEWLGQSVTLHHPHGQVYAYPYLPARTRDILRRAQELGTFIRMDMEDSSFTTRTIEMYDWARGEGFESVGLVIQSYLYRG